MLYDIEKRKIHHPLDCLSCPHYNAKKQLCEGINSCCFEYDEATESIIDSVTKIATRITEVENDG